MRGVHFSLRWLLGVVSFLAVACGLLIYASPFLSKLAFTAAVMALLVALFLASYRTGEQRAFWAGFAAFGLAYVWLVCGTWHSPDGSTALRERLVTTDLLIRCQDALPMKQTSVNVVTSAPFATAPVAYTGSVYFDPYGNMAQTASTPGGVFPYLNMTSGIVTTVDRADFLTTGHSLFAIVLAFVGGLIVRRCCLPTKTAAIPTAA